MLLLADFAAILDISQMFIWFSIARQFFYFFNEKRVCQLSHQLLVFKSRNPWSYECRSVEHRLTFKQIPPFLIQVMADGHAHPTTD